jgi:hypothetical protein
VTESIPAAPLRVLTVSADGERQLWLGHAPLVAVVLQLEADPLVIGDATAEMLDRVRDDLEPRWPRTRAAFAELLEAYADELADA